MRRARGEDGVSTIQYAVLMPVVIVVLMLIVQAGLLFHARQVAKAAAAEAVDAAQTPTASADDGERAARSFLAQSGNLEGLAVEVTRTPDVVTARVSGGAPQLVPGFAWRVTALATARTERFVPEPER